MYARVFKLLQYMYEGIWHYTFLFVNACVLLCVVCCVVCCVLCVVHYVLCIVCCVFRLEHYYTHGFESYCIAFA